MHNTQPDATELTSSVKPSVVVIARKTVGHNTRTDVSVPELLRSVGLSLDATVRFVPARDGSNPETTEQPLKKSELCSIHNSVRNIHPTSYHNSNPDGTESLIVTQAERRHLGIFHY